MMRLYLIRHCETDYTVQNRYCGFSNPALNNIGIWQAGKIASRFKDVKIDKVYSSDLKRAYQTAEIAFNKNSIEKLAYFREMNFGIFEGLKYEEVTKIHPELYKNWINEPPNFKIPSGECLRDLCKRVKEGLSYILSRHEDGTIALISHGGPIKIMLCGVLKSCLEKFWNIEEEPGALNIVDFPKNSHPAMVKMNDISHLSDEENVL